jgi:hypothetical protein
LGVTGTTVLAGLTTVTNTTSATSTTTGALVVTGGLGVGGAAYFGQTSYVSGAVILTTATLGIYGVSSITAGTDTAVNTATGAVTIWNTGTLQTVTNRGAVTTNQVTLNNGLILGSTAQNPILMNGNYSQSTPGFIVANGTLVGNAATTQIYAFNYQHNLAPVTTSTITAYYGQLFLPTLTNTATYTNMYGSFSRIDMTSGATTGSVSAWYGYFSAAPSRNAAADVRFTNHIGFYAQDPGFAVTATNIYGLQTAIGAGTGKYNIYSGGLADSFFNGNVGIGTNAPTTKLDVSGAVKISGITTVTNTTSATSTASGALQVAGGVGIGGTLWVGGTSNLQGVQATNITASGSLGVTGTTVLAGLTTITNATSATSTNTGALQVVGGVGIGGNLVIGSTATIIGSELSLGTFRLSAATSNAFKFTTGVNASSGAILDFAGNNNTIISSVDFQQTGVKISSPTTNSTSTNTGALQVVGGVGIGGDLYLGGDLYGSLGGGAPGSLVYQSATGTTAFLNIGLNGYVLTSNGTSPQWTALSGVSAGLATTATNLAGGGPGQVPYQSSTGTTAFVATGTAGTVLVSNGIGAPSFNNTLTLAGTAAATSTTTGALQVVGGVGIGGTLYATQLNSNRSDGVASSTYNISASNGTQYVNIIAKASDGNYNSATQANDSLIYFSAGTQGSGNLLIAPWSSTASGIRLIGSTGVVTVISTVSSTSTGSGALVIAGGVGIGRDLYVGGTSNLQGV